MGEMTMVERFRQYVDRQGLDDCWIWTGNSSPNRSGMHYGCFRADGKMKKAHRVAFELSNGPIPEGMVVRHRCDVSLCCNPRHLELGTQKDNVADRYERGRDNHLRGSAHVVSKLTEQDVKEIKFLIKTGLATTEIAHCFNVSEYPIWTIRKGKGWRHVDD